MPAAGVCGGANRRPHTPRLFARPPRGKVSPASPRLSRIPSPQGVAPVLSLRSSVKLEELRLGTKSLWGRSSASCGTQNGGAGRKTVRRMAAIVVMR